MSTPFFSIILTCDTRRNSDGPTSSIGDFGEGSLQGVRSFDFLTQLPVTIANFFSGYRYDLLLFIDEHKPLPLEVRNRMEELRAWGILSRWDCKPRNRVDYRWNCKLYLQALRMAHPNATHIVKIDQDCAMFREPDSFIVDRYVKWLERHSYVCQPACPGDGATHASTRFFVTKAGTMDLDEAERSLDDEYLREKYGEDKFAPCLEHNLGILCGGNVLYPPPQEEEYTVFNFARYNKGLLKKLNNMPYPAIQEYVQRCGIHGARDLVAQDL